MVLIAFLAACTLLYFHVDATGSSSFPGLQQRFLQGQEHVLEENQIQSIFTYIPRITVTDQAAIDLDQREIDLELNKAAYEGVSSGFDNAFNIYTKGAHSKSYARILLKDTVTVPTPLGAPVVGSSTAGEEIVALLLRSVEVGNRFIEVLYETSDDVRKHVGCQVGASMNPFLKGCFAAEGSVTIGSNPPIEYEYDVSSDNLNDRTIRNFSLLAERDMYNCNDNGTTGDPSGNRCPFQDYLNFYNYYGKYDYADEWITAAINGVSTTFPNNNNGANADFSKYGDVGRAEAIKRGTVYLHIWMYVIGRLESAISGCYYSCGSDPNDGACSSTDFVDIWDEAVGYYVGSLQMRATTDSITAGYFLYQLAVDNCKYFNTCGNGYNGDHDAVLNRKIFYAFVAGQQHLLTGRCAEAEENKERIVAFMKIPLIQGTLLMAYLLEHGDNYSEESQAQGATYAAAILPLIDACSTTDAGIIYRNMQVRGNTEFRPNFRDVKGAFERNYECFRLECNDVGGLLDITSGFTVNYMPGGEPCNDFERLSGENNGDPTGQYTQTQISSSPTTPQTKPPTLWPTQRPTLRPNPTSSPTLPTFSPVVTARPTPPHAEHHHHFYQVNELNPAMQATIALVLFFSMLCITLLCCFTWKVPPINDYDHGMT